MPKDIREPCSVEGCTRHAKSRGWCGTHYERWRKHGDLITGAILPAYERFWLMVDKGGYDECWIWNARVDQDGYGTFSVNGRPKNAPRYSYELFTGPIPDGMTLDHDCHTRDPSCAGGPTCPHRRCVNPAHLVPMPPVANVMLGRGASALNARKTHCKRAHEFTPENTRMRMQDGRPTRECLICRRAWRSASMPPEDLPAS